MCGLEISAVGELREGVLLIKGHSAPSRGVVEVGVNARLSNKHFAGGPQPYIRISHPHPVLM